MNPANSAFCRTFLLLLICAICSMAQSSTGTQSRPSRTQPIPARAASSAAENEQRTARLFEAARANPADLQSFLLRMPKGADLHNHLTGAVYAESWIREAAEDHFCVDLASLALVKPQSGAIARKTRFPSLRLLAINIFTTRSWMRFRCGDSCRPPASQATTTSSILLRSFRTVDPRHEG